MGSNHLLEARNAITLKASSGRPSPPGDAPGTRNAATSNEDSPPRQPPTTRVAPIETWCDDGSVSRVEPPWLRDRRIQQTKERIEALKAKKTKPRSTPNPPPPTNHNPFDSSTDWSDSSSSRSHTPRRRISLPPPSSRHNPFEDESADRPRSDVGVTRPTLPYINPFESTKNINPFDSSIDSGSPDRPTLPKPNNNTTNPFETSSESSKAPIAPSPDRPLPPPPSRPTNNSNPFDPASESSKPPRTPSPEKKVPPPPPKPTKRPNSSNPFDTSSESSKPASASSAQKPPPPPHRRPMIVRPSQQAHHYPNSHSTLSSKESISDSLDQFLQDGETAASGDPKGRRLSGSSPRVVTPRPPTPTSQHSGTPSENAILVAEALKQSFHRVPPRQHNRSSMVSATSGWSSDNPSPSRSQASLRMTPTPRAVPRSPEENQRTTPSPGVSARQSRPSYATPSPVQRHVPEPSHVSSADSDESQEAQGNRLDAVPDAHLALHDLCDEARSTDDIAWRNALYLLSVQPHLARQLEPEGQMSPLHVACLGQEPPPTWMTRGLIYTNPQQCQLPDSGGRLPLHLLAATTAHAPTMQMMVEEFPASVAHCDARGFTPLQLLLKNDQVDLTLEHLRILLGQTHSTNTSSTPKKRPLFRKREHLQQSFQDLQSLQSIQQTKHESAFEEFPGDVQQALRKITQWKRRQRNRGLEDGFSDGRLALVYDNPAAIPTPTGGMLPLHLLVKRLPQDPTTNELGQPVVASLETLIRVCVAAYPEALISREGNGRTPLMTALLHTTALPSQEVIQLLLGLQTPGFADDPQMSPAKLASVDTLQVPLHVAAEELPHNFEIISTIYEAYPAAAQVQDIRGRTPLHCALQNYHSISLEPRVFELLANDYVAKIPDHDGRRPVDLIAETPDCLERIDDDDGMVLASFLDASIPPSRNHRDREEIMRKMHQLPPWLRRHACASQKVQEVLLEQLATPTNTFLALIQVGALICLMVSFRLAVADDYLFAMDPWILVCAFGSYHLVTQVIYWGTAWQVGELSRLVFGNVWKWIELGAVTSSIAMATVMRDGGTIEQDELQMLSSWTTGLLWASLVGALAQWWCGMAIFIGSAFQLLRTLVWPLVVAVMGIIAMSQVLYTVNGCTEEYTCGRVDTLTAVYWLILGEPIIGAEDLSLFDTTMSISMVATLVSFTIVWLWWVLSTLVMTVSEGHRLDRNKIAQQWYWEPKVALTVFAPSTPKLYEPPTLVQRYCDGMESVWDILTSSSKSRFRRDQEHWYACCFRPGLVALTRLLAVIIVPIWLLLGLVTLGLLWPPQVRRWLFATNMTRYSKHRTMEAELTAAKVSKLKSAFQQLQTQTKEESHSIQQELGEIKEILYRAMLEEE